jgi:hypothetical protein
MRVTGKTPAVAGERLKLVFMAAASSIWGSWRARAATAVDLGGLRRGEQRAASVPTQAAGCLSGAVMDSAA